MPEVNTPTIFEQLLDGRVAIGQAMDYKRLNGCWISCRKYGALINRVNGPAASSQHRPAAARQTSNGWELKVTKDNLPEGKRWLDTVQAEFDKSKQADEQ